VDITSYEFGLICIDASGTKTRHIFGRGSFDNAETFDTLAECSECVGLDDQRAVAFRAQRKHWQQSEEANEVATLSEEVKTLTQGMTSMLGAVLKLRQKEEEKKKTTPPPSVVATLAAWSGEGTSDDVSAGESEAGEPPATPAAAAPAAAASAAVTPRLRAAAASAASTAQVKKRRHRRRRVVEEEDEDDEDSDNDDQEDDDRDTQEDKGRRKQPQTQDDHKDNDDGDEYQRLTPSTNGIGETLDEGADAESSELAVASDGEASAGALDDGSMGVDAAW
jgi:hypothetical protein